MLQQQRLNSKGEKYVIGPTGAPLTLSDLPPANTQRWVIRRKAEVVAAVRGGLLSLDDACMRYSLTNEEFLAWQRSIDRHGMAGLRTTRIQQYRYHFSLKYGHLKVTHYSTRNSSFRHQNCLSRRHQQMTS